MPELPDIELYLAALADRVAGRRLLGIKLLNPFVLRSVAPPPNEFANLPARGFRRIGKRIVIEFEGEKFIVIHLMIAGRLRWGSLASKPPGGKLTLAVLEFESGNLYLTEAGSKKRASVTLVAGESALQSLDPGGAELARMTLVEFQRLLQAESHTVKLRLTDPRVFSGIGNAFSDEILFAAKLSPVKLTSRLSDDEVATLFESSRAVLAHWTEKLRRDFDGRFPGAGEVTAFRPEFAVHGKLGQPCPVCGAKVLRIRYSDNECNYCAVCQNNGKPLADRAMSRLLK